MPCGHYRRILQSVRVSFQILVHSRHPPTHLCTMKNCHIGSSVIWDISDYIYECRDALWISHERHFGTECVCSLKMRRVISNLHSLGQMLNFTNLTGLCTVVLQEGPNEEMYSNEMGQVIICN